jgi:hypothetical protein
MANTIATAIEYINNQQEVMRMYNTYLLSADLIKNIIEHKGKTVSYDALSFSSYAMGDYDRASGLSDKDFIFERKTETLSQDKGDALKLDIADQNEAQIAGGIARVYNFYQVKVVIPTIDTYTFGKVCATGGNAKAFGTLTSSNIVGSIFKLFAEAKKKRIKTEECLFYITASANALLDEAAFGRGVLTVGVWKGNGNWNGDLQTTCTMVKGAKVVEVPDDYLGGVAFALVHPLAFDLIPVLDIVKFHDDIPGKPGMAQVDVREYFDAWKQPNGEDGVWLGLEAPRKLDFVKGTNKVTGFTNVEKGAKIYYTTNGSEPTTSSTQWTSGDISVSANATIKAIQVLDGQSSAVASWQNA